MESTKVNEASSTPVATDASATSPQSTLGKRKREVEEANPDKRQRGGSQSIEELPPSKDLLTRRNLAQLNSETASQTSQPSDGMAERKRSLSRRSSTTDLTQESTSVSSHKSSFSLANYRLKSLDRSRIVVRHRGIPTHLESRVDAIIKPKFDTEKETIVFSIADSLCDGFRHLLGGARREDDYVALVDQALGEMNSKLCDNAFAIRRNADWNPALKPTVQPRLFSLRPPDKALQDASDSHERPNKRQQAGASYMSPDSSQMVMPPPPPPPKPDMFYVKTPRPDITIGFELDIVVKKLGSLGIKNLDAQDMLKALDDGGELLSSPFGDPVLGCFPSMVVEGKSYETGRSISEAENQVAVSGSCLLVIQDQLAKLTERCSPETHQGKEPLAFSITHEGPILLLWLHYFTYQQGVRFCNMHVLKIGHATLLSTTREFMSAVAGVMEWASTEFLDGIAAQLALVWKGAQEQTT